VGRQPGVAGGDSYSRRHEAIGFGPEQGLEQAQAAGAVFKEEGVVAVVDERDGEQLALQPARQKRQEFAVHDRQIKAIRLTQGLETAAVGGEQPSQGGTPTAETALQVGVIEQRLDLQIDASGGQPGLELRQPHAVASGVGGVEGEAENRPNRLVAIQIRAFAQSKSILFRSRESAKKRLPRKTPATICLS